ncbi:uncharacterized protein LOC144103518 [Amblyomma americanum]
MSVTTTAEDDTTEANTTTSWSRRSRKDGHDFERDLLEAMNLSYSELQQLSALSEEGPRAPVNSFESLGSVSASRPESRTSIGTRPSSLGTSESSQENPPRASSKGDRSPTEVSSEAPPPAERSSSHGASARSLVWVTTLVVAFIAAFAYAVFLFRLNSIPAPERKTGAPRSTNDTGSNSG